MTGPDFPAPKAPLPAAEPPRGWGHGGMLRARVPLPFPGVRSAPGMLCRVPGLGVAVPWGRSRSLAGNSRGSAPRESPPLRLVKESRKMREKKKSPSDSFWAKNPRKQKRREVGGGAPVPPPGVGRGRRSGGFYRTPLSRKASALPAINPGFNENG